MAPTPVVAAVASVISGNLVERVGYRWVAIPGSLFYALGALLLALRTGSQPDYVADYLRSALLLGLGVGMTIAPVTAAALAELPATRISTGSAINTAIRQVGAVLGVSLLVAVIGRAGPGEALGRLHTAWSLVAVIAALTAVPLALMGRVTVRDPSTPATAASSHEHEC